MGSGIKRRKLFQCNYCGLTVNYLKGHIKAFHRKQYKMKEQEPNLFEGQGKCDICGKDKLVHLIFHAGKWIDTCNGCEQLRAPYLKHQSSNKKPEKIGNIRI